MDHAPKRNAQKNQAYAGQRPCCRLGRLFRLREIRILCAAQDLRLHLLVPHFRPELAKKY